MAISKQIAMALGWPVGGGGVYDPNKGVGGAWILATRFWRDTGVWSDTATWRD